MYFIYANLLSVQLWKNDMIVKNGYITFLNIKNYLIFYFFHKISAFLI